MSYPRRELLVKSVLSTMSTYFMTVFKMPKWAHSRIDKFRRSFLWKVDDPERVKGDHCLINWQTCILPKKWGRSWYQRFGEIWHGPQNEMALTQVGYKGKTF
jgi:hypothetical protein